MGRGGRLKTVSLAVILAAFLFVLGFIRPVKIAGDHGSGTLWLWAWQKGRVEFINSVTGRPVVISFKMPWRFSGFSVRTDPGTEEYYTAGGYSWNEQLSKERTRITPILLRGGNNLDPGWKSVPRARRLYPRGSPLALLRPAGGLMLVYSSWIFDAVGLGLVALVIFIQKFTPPKVSRTLKKS